MKNTLFSLSAGLVLSAAPSVAETEINPSLLESLSKVDADGEYLELTYLKDDVKKLTRYLDVLVESLKKNKEGFPQKADAKELLTLTGLDKVVSSAVSRKKVEGSWNNTYYTYTEGNFDGIFSIYGSKSELVEVAKFAPANVDMAMQMKLDLRKLGPVLTEVARQLDLQEDLQKNLEREIPELGNATVIQLIEKADIRFNMLMNMDSAKPLPLPFPGVKIPTTDILFRLDNAAWLWEYIEPLVLEKSNLPWVKKVEGEVTTLTLPPELKQQFMGYSLTFKVEKENIWFSTSEVLLADCLGDGAKLANDAEYMKTIKTLPKEANIMYYISHNGLKDIHGIYTGIATTQENSNPKFKAFSPFINRIFKDFLSSNSGIAMIVDADDDGFKSVIRAPFPMKNYNQLLLSLLGTIGDELE